MMDRETGIVELKKLGLSEQKARNIINYALIVRKEEKKSLKLKRILDAVEKEEIMERNRKKK